MKLIDCFIVANVIMILICCVGIVTSTKCPSFLVFLGIWAGISLLVMIVTAFPIQAD
jgi:hypothetical protein